jgi:hypothetical protein
MLTLAAAVVAGVAVLWQIRLHSARNVAASRAMSSNAHAAASGRALSVLGHLAVLSIPFFVLAVNWFWWLPGVWLMETKGPSGFAFAHPEGVLTRLGQIARTEPPIQCMLIAAGLPGMFVLFHRDRILGWACLGFCAAGFGWGYVAGAARSLDFLQPGRHTFAFFTALSVSGGAMLDELLRRLRERRHGLARLDLWAIAGAILIALRVIGYPGHSVFESVRGWFVPEPFLSSRPPPRALWIVEQVSRHVKPGERLLYEEGGFGIAGVPEPFQGGRLSGILAERIGIELIGGPYLHASLRTNFTQFGEGKLCGKADWTKDDFIRYAKLYGPSAILCWTPHARRFCKENPGLIRTVADDGKVLLGRVEGFEGKFLEGGGTVDARAGVLTLRDLTPGLDGSVVLRYHSVPNLRARPAVALEEEKREDDPVPFIRLRPTPGMSDVELKLHFPIVH